LKNKHFQYKAKEKYDPAFLVKGRNEPCKMVEVLEAVAQIKNISQDELARIAWENTCKVFKIE